MSDQLMSILKNEEGFRLTVYDDATSLPIHPGSQVGGHPTIGYGRALDVRGITSAEAEYLLGNDVDLVITQLGQNLSWYHTLDQPRKDVLAAMAYQLGVRGLLSFTRMLSAVETGNYALAGSEMMQSKWATQTPARATRMSKLMTTGVYPVY